MSLLKDVIGRGTHAARPAAGSAGHIYFETDTGEFFRDNGSSWDALALDAATLSTRWEPITTADATCLITSRLDPVMALASSP